MIILFAFCMIVDIWSISVCFKITVRDKGWLEKECSKTCECVILSHERECWWNMFWMVPFRCILFWFMNVWWLFHLVVHCAWLTQELFDHYFKLFQLVVGCPYSEKCWVFNLFREDVQVLMLFSCVTWVLYLCACDYVSVVYLCYLSVVLVCMWLCFWCWLSRFIILLWNVHKRKRLSPQFLLL